MTTPSDLLKALKGNQKVKNKLVDILAEQAANAPNPLAFFKAILQLSNLPQKWKMERAAVYTGDAGTDALFLIEWAVGRGVNVDVPTYTAIGSILEPLLTKVGLDEAREIASVIVAYCLYRDNDMLTNLMMTYNMPLPAERLGEGALGCGADSVRVSMAGTMPGEQIGPKIDWRGPDEKTLESWPWSQPDFYDVGFWRRATDRTDSVCLIKLEKRKRSGTGFMIGKDLLISNYHVFRDADEGETEAEMEENIKDAALLFKYETDEDGNEGEPKMTFKLADENPLLAASHTDELDFVLLRVEPSINDAEGIKPLEYTPRDIGIGKGLNIIQHPGGDTMKIALSDNKVAYTGQEGIIQYKSRTAGGSSGAPCFNDKWELIALHHASVSTALGSNREGILFSNIYEKIKDKL